jgi:hypothetical protein
MLNEQSPGKPTTRRYSEEEKTAAVRMVGDVAGRFGRRGVPPGRVRPVPPRADTPFNLVLEARP